MKSQKEYLEELGNKCPICNSENLEKSYTLGFDGSSAWRDLKCLDCKTTWTEHLAVQLHSFGYVRVPQPEPQTIQDGDVEIEF